MSSPEDSKQSMGRSMREDLKLNMQTESPDSKSWMQERQLLLDMLEKNQKFAQQSQQAWKKEKEDVEAHHAMIEQSLKKQLAQAKDENKLLKAEIERTYANKEGDEGNFRIELLRELERLDYAAQDRESDMENEIKTLKNQLHSLQASVAQNKNRMQEEKQYLQTQLEIARKDANKIQTDFQRSLDELGAKHDRATKDLYLKNQELERVKNEYEAKLKNLTSQKHEGEDNWTSDKKGYLSESSKVAKLLQIREQATAAQLQTIRQEKVTIEKYYIEKNQNLEEQNQQLRANLQELTTLTQKKEKNLTHEVARLRDSNSRIMELSQQREAKLEKDFDALSSHLKKIQAQYEQREATFLTKNMQHLQDISKYEELLQRYHDQELQASPATEALRNEVKTLQSQLKDKDEKNSNLRELFLNSKHSERRTITKAISSVQSLLHDISKQQKLLIREESNYTAALRDLEQQATEKEKQQAQNYYDICQQLDELRKEYHEFRSNNWEVQVQQLTEENVKLKQEIEIARANIMNNHQIIQDLQNGLDSDNPNPSDITKNQDMEIRMLNTENNSLVENMTRLEDYYKREISQLQNFLEKKNYQLEQLYSKADRARTNKAKKHLDEIASWQNRQLTFTKTIKNLENKVKGLTIQEDARRKLSTHEASLEQEELKLLRNEVNQKEEWMDNLRQAFETEKKDLMAEVERLRGTIYSFSQTQDRNINLLNEEYSLLKSNRERLLETISSMNQQIEMLSSNSFLASKYDDNQQKILEHSYNEIMEINKEEVEALKSQINHQRETHLSELERIKSASSAEIGTLREVERALNKHIQAQQEEIDQLTMALTDEKQQHAEELENLRSELHALRRVNSKRHDSMRHEKDSLTTDVNRLLGIVQHKDDSNPVLDKIMEIEKILEGKFQYDKPANILPAEPKNEEENEPSNEDEIELTLRELTALKNLESVREKHRTKEREAISNIIHKLQKSILFVQDYAQKEHDNIAKELEMANKKLKSAQAEKEYLKKQRDDLVQTLSKARSLSKTDRNAVSKLIDQLKNSLNTKK